jgi:hypothetical protein
MKRSFRRSTIYYFLSSIFYLLGGEKLPGRFGAAGPHRPTEWRLGAGCSKDGLDQDDPATVKMWAGRPLSLKRLHFISALITNHE